MPPHMRSSEPRRGRKCGRRWYGSQRKSAMNSKPPFIRQERPDACAIACLRMVLASQGTKTTEAELVQSGVLQPSGMDPEELVRPAQRYGVRAEERQLDRDDLFALIRRQRLPIVFLYRRLISGV